MGGNFARLVYFSTPPNMSPPHKLKSNQRYGSQQRLLFPHVIGAVSFRHRDGFKEEEENRKKEEEEQQRQQNQQQRQQNQQQRQQNQQNQQSTSKFQDFHYKMKVETKCPKKSIVDVSKPIELPLVTDKATISPRPHRASLQTEEDFDDFYTFIIEERNNKLRKLHESKSKIIMNNHNPQDCDIKLELPSIEVSHIDNNAHRQNVYGQHYGRVAHQKEK
jgi:hypothetical protein